MIIIYYIFFFAGKAISTNGMQMEMSISLSRGVAQEEKKKKKKKDECSTPLG